MVKSSESSIASENSAASECLPEKQFVSSLTDNENDLCTMDWQSTKCTVRERFEFIFENKLLCDVHFIVGSDKNIKTIGAHKLVLAAGSIIFLTMFSEKWSADCGEVEVPDVEPAAFLEMLRFLYSDKIVLTSENVTAVLYAAKKYSIAALQNKCADFLSKKLCPENAFGFLIQGRLFDCQKLVDECLGVIAENTLEAVETEEFCNIDVETLCLFLKRSDLTIHESPLFDAVIRWSETACKKEHIPINPKNQRHVLKNALSFVRFPLMDPDDFASKVVRSRVLSETETVSVMTYFVKTVKLPECLFSDTPRKTFYVANRFQHIVSKGSYNSASNLHEIKFSSNVDVRLLGIGLYGSPHHSAVYPIEVTINEFNYTEEVFEVLEEFSGTYDGSKEIFRVMFDTPIQLPEDHLHLLQVKIQGEYFRYGCGGSDTVSVNINADKNVTFTFSSDTTVDSEMDRGKKTNVYSGQIPQLLFDM